MKPYHWIWIISLFLVTACAAPVDPTEVPRSTPATSDSPLAVPAPDESPLPEPAVMSAAERSAAQTLQPLVAEKVAVADEALEVVEMERVTWNDTSLGCPQPGQMYAQVLTPGWRAVFQDASGQRYTVHTAEDLASFVICDAPEDAPRFEEPTPEPEHPAVKAALDLMARQFGATRDELDVLSRESQQWPNSCLGCASPQEVCLMVVTPGYRIKVAYKGGEYVVHTDATGRVARLCGALR